MALTNNVDQNKAKELLPSGSSSQSGSNQGSNQGSIGVPPVSAELGSLLEKKKIQEQRIKASLEHADRLDQNRFTRGRFAQRVRDRVAAGEYISNISSTGGGRKGNKTTVSSTTITFAKQEVGLDDLIASQRSLDLQKFEAQQSIIQAQERFAESILDQIPTPVADAPKVRDRELSSIDRLKTEQKKRRGTTSLRTRGSRRGRQGDLLAEETNTTGGLLG